MGSNVSRKDRLMSLAALWGHNIGSLSREIGLSSRTLSRKIRGSSDFTETEMRKLKRVLKIPDEQAVEIFLSE